MNATTKGIALAVTLVLSSSLAASPVRAQSLGSRIDAVRDGRVRLTFAARSGVCGNGNSWYRSRDGGRSGQFNGMWNGGNDVENTCEQGPVRVVVVRSRGGMLGVTESTAALRIASCCSVGSPLYSASHFWKKPWASFMTLLS